MAFRERRSVVNGLAGGHRRTGLRLSRPIEGSGEGPWTGSGLSRPLPAPYASGFNRGARFTCGFSEAASRLSTRLIEKVAVLSRGVAAGSGWVEKIAIPSTDKRPAPSRRSGNSGWRGAGLFSFAWTPCRMAVETARRWGLLLHVGRHGVLGGDAARVHVVGVRGAG